MPFVLADGAVAGGPQGRRIGWGAGVLSVEKLGVYPHRQHFFIVTAVEYCDFSALGERQAGAP
jgi:hypothetical protein